MKRLRASELRNIRKVGLRVITLDPDDELISVQETRGEDYLLIATHSGMAICFRETDVRPTGRSSMGVRGISLREEDYVVGAVSCRADSTALLLTVTENGYGKKTPLKEYFRQGEEAQHRGGVGRRNCPISEKTGPVAAIRMVEEGDEILLMSSDGVVIRTSTGEISTYGRNAQGVRVMRLDPGVRVISLARLAAEPVEPEPEEPLEELEEDLEDLENLKLPEEPADPEQGE